MGTEAHAKANGNQKKAGIRNLNTRYLFTFVVNLHNMHETRRDREREIGTIYMRKDDIH